MSEKENQTGELSHPSGATGDLYKKITSVLKQDLRPILMALPQIMTDKLSQKERDSLVQKR